VNRLIRTAIVSAAVVIAFGTVRLHSGRSADHQVPAGTLLSIELRTALSSDTSTPHEAIRGVLTSAITVDDVELVPAGAVLLGTVTDVVPAVSRFDRARLAFRFHVLEHPGTGSRVPIKTEVKTYAVDAGKRKKGAEGTAAFNQVRLDAGAHVSAFLREPFLVRIPSAKLAPGS
jgi:hypothetical protein